MNLRLNAFIDSILPFVLHDADITDNFFITVESNPVFMNAYNALCLSYTQASVNKRIGNLIKRNLGLNNNGRNNATSSLIKTYTIH